MSELTLIKDCRLVSIISSSVARLVVELARMRRLRRLLVILGRLVYRPSALKSGSGSTANISLLTCFGDLPVEIKSSTLSPSSESCDTLQSPGKKSSDTSSSPWLTNGILIPALGSCCLGDGDSCRGIETDCLRGFGMGRSPLGGMVSLLEDTDIV